MESYWALRTRLQEMTSPERAKQMLDRLSPSQRQRLWEGQLSLSEVLHGASPSKPEDGPLDVLVVGSGMAGVVAAQQLVASGLRVLVLEAGSRGGGRAVVDSSLGPALDLGAAWIHCGEENPLTELARGLGLTLVPDPHQVRAFRDGVEETEEFARSLKRIHQAWHEAGAEIDIPLSEVALSIPEDWDEEAVMALSSLSIGVEAPEGSSREYNQTADEVGDFLVLEGLGRVVEAFSHGLRIELERPVERIRWGSEGVEVEAAGKNYRARLLILTPAVGVLSSGSISFDPPLPQAKTEALASVQMGCLDKILLRFDRDVMPGSTPNSVIYSKGRRLAFLVRPFSLDLAIAFVGGQKAASMASVSAEAEIAEAVDEFAAIYGDEVRRALTGAQVTRWCQDPFTRGSYSSAKPGQQAARKELCRPETGLILAGEACHEKWAGTLTGAYLSGLRAASEALEQLGVKRP